MDSKYKRKYFKYKRKYFKYKNQIGRMNIKNYFSDNDIQHIFILRNPISLNITLHIYWTLYKYVYSSPIIKIKKVKNKMICIDNTNTIYITKIPKFYNVSHSLSIKDFN